MISAKSYEKLLIICEPILEVEDRKSGEIRFQWENNDNSELSKENKKLRKIKKLKE
jgi:hypothetical protein